MTSSGNLGLRHSWRGSGWTLGRNATAKRAIVQFHWLFAASFNGLFDHHGIGWKHLPQMVAPWCISRVL